jgi:UDP-N-acetylglucosamine diphosphorylase/glucosamine-1-phosphate N-acetyltransferase
MNYILFDDVEHDRLLPFTHTRPVADIRCGIMTMRERWEHCLQATTGSLTQEYMQAAFPDNTGDDNIVIRAAVFATATLVKAIHILEPGRGLAYDGELIAMHYSGAQADAENVEIQEYEDDEVFALRNVWDIFIQNDRAIREDFALLTNGRKSAAIPAGVTVTGAEHIFIEAGANIYPGCIINAATGPVYIGKNTEVLEGALIRGPLATGAHSVIKMGAKIYGATTIGPGCKVGGEINNVVFFANSNKAHDGYLGNAVVGEWCNLGADTNCSNLKNNYGEVKIWDEAENKLVPTGLTFCGLLMGDHSKCAINTMFNTGTVVGVSCNIFGGGFPEKFVPSFSWGGSGGVSNYEFDKAMETAGRMMARRDKKLSVAETAMYRHIYDTASNSM